MISIQTLFKGTYCIFWAILITITLMTYLSNKAVREGAIIMFVVFAINFILLASTGFFHN